METAPSRGGLYALVAANAVSHLGNVFAVVAFATTLPLALGAVVGGPIVDRIGTRRASVVTDVGSAAAIALIPLLHAQELIPPDLRARRSRSSSRWG